MRTYGELQVATDVSGRAWFGIRAEPHVSMKLKQVFPRVSPQFGIIRIAITEDTARDLEWFMDRYPLRGSDEAVMLVQHHARAHDRRRARTAEALLGKSDAKPARRMALPARDYQEVAAALAHASGALLLADDIGTGKTCSAIRMLASEGALPAVVIVMTHLQKQWAAELVRFIPDLRVHIAKSGSAYSLTAGPRGKGQPMPDVVVMNYHKVAGWAEALAGWARSVVFDEVQELRHAGSAKYKGSVHLVESANIVMGLSGTPIYGFGEEWFNVLDALKPRWLGTRDEYLREWCVHLKGEGEKAKFKLRDPAAFGSYLYESGVMLRRTRKDVGRELPPCQAIWHVVDHDAAVLEAGASAAAELAAAIVGQRQVTPAQMRDISAEFVNQLRQQTGIAKAPYVADFVRLLVESGEKVLLFGWHRSVYEIWRERLNDLAVVWYTGSESDTQKARAASEFGRPVEAGGAQVMVMSLRSGAGLDGLQRVCSVVVLGELDWSPQVMGQCIGRVDRDGQETPVVAYYLTADDGADPTMLDVATVKRTQMVAVRDPERPLVEETTADPEHVKKLAAAFLERRK